MNNQENERLATQKTQVSDLRLACGEIRTDIKKIMRNELPHLRLLIVEKITKLKESVNEEFKKFDKRLDKSEKKLLIIWTILLVVATVVQIIIAQLLKKYLP